MDEQILHDGLSQQVTTTKRVIGPGQAATQAWLSGDMTLDDACSFIALSTQGSLDDYPVRAYTHPAMDLFDYIGSRIAKLVERDKRLSIANAEWLRAVSTTRRQNLHDMEFLSWAAEQCKKIGSGDVEKIIRQHIIQHELNPFPTSLYQEACRVQKLDLEERMSGEK